MEYMSREDYCEISCGKENREGYKTCHNCSMTDVPAADVQPVDRDSLQIVYIGRKAYHAENTIRSAIEAMDTIRDAIGHIEYTYSKHKELLSQISCCTKYGDATPEIDYYINKIKEATSQID